MSATLAKVVTHMVKVIEVSPEYVRYAFSNGMTGIAVREWFPQVKVDQVWELWFEGAKIIHLERIPQE